ncbi:MAG: cell division protein FtsL [Rhodocyclaceae bacterium]|nr:cell division protein FtsL [Rhodocyclaceae bacterium]MCL4758796.1 cell division protein FtsL [Rhodocyclaceae bacterium]
MIRIDALLLSLVVASALGVVASQHQSRKVYAEFEREQSRTHELEVEWGQLQLEQSTWAALSRVESLARTRLGMGEPGPGRMIVVEASR